MNAITLSATGVYRIGQAGATPSGPGGWYLVFTGSDWTGSVVLAQDLNAPGSVSKPITSGSLTNVGYYDPSTGAAVAAAVAITSTGNWQVDSTSFDLYLNYTHTSGSVVVSIQPGSQLVGEPVEGQPLAAGYVTRGTFGANIPDTGTYTFPAALVVAGTSLSLSTTGTASAISGTAKVGTNLASGALTVNGHTGTGTGAVGGIIFKIPVTTSSGAGAQTLTTVLTLSATTTVASTFAGPLAITGALSGVTTLAMGGALSGVTTVAASGVLTLTDATDSTSATTGAIIASGGVGVAKALFVGTSIKSVSPTAGIGYATGAGGAQAQSVNKAGTVVSNTITTAITMDAAALNAGVTVAFTFTNSSIAATDTVICTHQSAGTSGAYTVNAFPGAGSAVISVRNNTAGSLSEAIVLRVTVIKSVSA